MRKQTIYCDICGVEGARERWFLVGYQPDSNGTESVHELLDLCPEHTALAYELAEKKYKHECGKYVYNELKLKVKNKNG
jgi:hypothetical protein